MGWRSSHPRARSPCAALHNGNKATASRRGMKDRSADPPACRRRAPGDARSLPRDRGSDRSVISPAKRITLVHPRFSALPCSPAARGSAIRVHNSFISCRRDARRGLLKHRGRKIYIYIYGARRSEGAKRNKDDNDNEMYMPARQHPHNAPVHRRGGACILNIATRYDLRACASLLQTHSSAHNVSRARICVRATSASGVVPGPENDSGHGRTPETVRVHSACLDGFFLAVELDRWSSSVLIS